MTTNLVGKIVFYNVGLHDNLIPCMGIVIGISDVYHRERWYAAKRLSGGGAPFFQFSNCEVLSDKSQKCIKVGITFATLSL